jgi:hypothetical protein
MVYQDVKLFSLNNLFINVQMKLLIYLYLINVLIVSKEKSKEFRNDFFLLDSTIVDTCSKRSMTSSNGLNLISPSFPNEYPNNVNCTCSIEPTETPQQLSPIIINVEVEIQDFIMKINFFVCLESFI